MTGALDLRQKKLGFPLIDDQRLSLRGAAPEGQKPDDCKPVPVPVQGDLGQAVAKKRTQALVLAQVDERRCGLGAERTERAVGAHRLRQIFEALADEGPQPHLDTGKSDGLHQHERFARREFGLSEMLNDLAPPPVDLFDGVIPGAGLDLRQQWLDDAHGPNIDSIALRID